MTTILRRQNASCFPMSCDNGLPLDPCQNWTYISMSIGEICTRYREIKNRRLSKKRVVKLLLRCRSTSEAYTEYVQRHKTEVDDIVATF